MSRAREADREEARGIFGQVLQRARQRRLTQGTHRLRRAQEAAIPEGIADRTDRLERFVTESKET